MDNTNTQLDKVSDPTEEHFLNDQLKNAIILVHSIYAELQDVAKRHNAELRQLYIDLEHATSIVQSLRNHFEDYLDPDP